MRKFALVVAAIAGFFLLTATALYFLARPLPSALILDQTCAPPCWLGIRPRDTSSWGVSEALLAARFVDQPSIQQWDDGLVVDRITWRFRRPAGDLAGFAYFEGETVSYLTVLALGAMDLGDALLKYGNPDVFWLEQRDLPAEAWTQVNIAYLRIACVLEVRLDHTGEPTPASIALAENTPVRAVSYFDPDEMPTDLLVPAGQLHEWQGLGGILLPTPTQ